MNDRQTELEDKQMHELAALMLHSLHIPTPSPAADLQFLSWIEAIEKAMADPTRTSVLELPLLQQLASDGRFYCRVWAEQQRLLLERLSKILDDAPPPRFPTGVIQS